MEEESGHEPGLLARITADPIRLRRWSWLALLAFMLLTIAGRLLGGWAGGMLAALTWICAPIIAFGIGAGDAFFVRNGRAVRRIAVSILVSVCIAVSSCAILATFSNSSSSRAGDIVVALLYAVLFGGMVVGLAGLIALGIGRGEDYVSRRIDRMSREDW